MLESTTLLIAPVIAQVPAPGNAALISFSIYLVAVFALAWLSSVKRSKSSGFISEYFLGSRNLGVVAFALTFAATSASGGSFVGFPSLIYSHGWVLALWIAGYMVVPIMAMGLMGKRLNHISRAADAITIPDVIEKRLGSPLAGVVATLLIVMFISYVLFSQFKAGSQILLTLFSGVPAFDSAVNWVANTTGNWKLLAGTEPDYILCLGVFSLATIIYVVYGGFRAVVWTDVMQGVIMFFGVVFLLTLSLWLTGGLESATQQLGQRTPPTYGLATLSVEQVSTEDRVVRKGSWVMSDEGELTRTAKGAVIRAGKRQANDVPIIELTCQEDRDGVPSSAVSPEMTVKIQSRENYAFGQQTRGVYLSPPGPHRSNLAGFLPLSLAFSFFVFWPFGSSGQPSNMVRLMAFRDTRTLKLSLVTLTFYFSMIYFSLVVIFCCARVMLPGMEAQSDRVMPQFALHTTRLAGVPWLAGFLLAAPFAAVMSTVDSFLLMVSSALVRDIYQRFIHPSADERLLKRVTYIGTIFVGTCAAIGALWPPPYLQHIIVDATGFLASSFFAPVILSLYWRRLTAPGAIIGMLTGGFVHAIFSFDLYQYFAPLGWMQSLEVVNPLVWGILASALVSLDVSLLTRPPQQPILDRFFPQ